MKTLCVNMKPIGSTLLSNVLKENFYRAAKDKDFICLSSKLPLTLYTMWVDKDKPTFFKPDKSVPEDYIVIDDSINDHPLLYIYNNLNDDDENNLFQFVLSS